MFSENSGSKQFLISKNTCIYNWCEFLNFKFSYLSLPQRCKYIERMLQAAYMCMYLCVICSNQNITFTIYIKEKILVLTSFSLSLFCKVKIRFIKEDIKVIWNIKLTRKDVLNEIPNLEKESLDAGVGKKKLNLHIIVFKKNIFKV